MGYSLNTSAIQDDTLILLFNICTNRIKLQSQSQYYLRKQVPHNLQIFRIV